MKYASAASLSAAVIVRRAGQQKQSRLLGTEVDVSQSEQRATLISAALVRCCGRLSDALHESCAKEQL